jgi:mannose-1-phosphate guanylyltransferase
LAGGGGTRLWPKSREETPKQFLPLFQKRSLFQLTVERTKKLLPLERIFVVTVSDKYKKEILKEAPDLIPENIIVEPVRRDSAPAHALGAAKIFKLDNNAVIVNAASDHLIDPEESYRKVMLAAASKAYEGDWLVAVGIKPRYPHTGMGHLKIGKKIGVSEGEDVFEREAHVEKPELKLAEKYTKSGDYFWNANQYVWRADTFLNAIRKHAPEIGKSIDRMLESFGQSDEEKIIKTEYEKVPKISVDYAVSEKADNFLMLVADYTWTDVGDWSEVWKNLPKNKDNNVIIDGDEKGGSVINIDTSNTLVQTDGKLIAIIDVDDIAIIDTKDVLLVCKQSRAQSVKKVVEKLKEDKLDKYL